MKHNLKIIFILLALFLITQITGLWISYKYSLIEELPFGIEKLEVEQESASFLPIFIMIIIATFLGLLLMHYKLFNVWRFWFFITVIFTLTISLSIFIGQILALIIAIIFGFLKVYKHNIYIHNLTEIFIYGALAAIFVPIFNIFSIIILLILISVYDYIAVRKTKHMVKLAKSQSQTKTFAGFYVPYKKGAAILGGGDIGFALLFAATIIKELSISFFSFKAFVIPFFSALALLTLFLIGKDKKFYPAMPFVTAGCLLGYIILIFI
ncbi:MAG: presenilin family intramembrane aspartyl protease [Nanoarchaeota archaeon]|nr:presenilin family intramembrane aspartyl protease [Nanoarchaeota archaeon]